MPSHLRRHRTKVAVAALALALAACAQLIGAEFDGARLDGGLAPSANDAASDVTTGMDAEGEADGGPFDANAGDLLFWVAADKGVLDGGAIDASSSTGSTLAPTWKDLSGHGRDLSQGFLAKQPLLVPSTLNGLPIVRFEKSRGSCYGSNWIGPPGTRGATVFVLARGEPTSIVRFQGPNPGELVFPWNTRYAEPSAPPDFAFLIATDADTAKLRMRFDERIWTLAVGRVALDAIGGMQVFENGVLLESASIYADAMPAPDEFQVGCAPGQLSEFANADVAEIMIYGTALSDPDRIAVENYLKQKWALTF